MSKCRGSQHEFAGPDIVNMDLLATISDDELNNRHQRLENEREALLNGKVSVRAWEEEIAYVRREQGIRRARREAHDAYLGNGHKDQTQIDVLSHEYDETSAIAVL
jgi:hypothetical protein